MTRERMPDRRRCWTQKVKIEGKSFYLTCGEDPDGRLGEIFLVADREGTFARGLLDGIARMASIALQCGACAEEVVRAIRHSNFPPNGPVEGAAASAVTRTSSVLDWVAQEVEAAYLKGPPAALDPVTPDPMQPEPPQMRGVAVPYQP